MKTIIIQPKPKTRRRPLVIAGASPRESLDKDGHPHTKLDICPTNEPLKKGCPSLSTLFVSLALALVFVSSVNAQSSLKKASNVFNRASNVTSKLKPVLGSSGTEIQSTISEASSYAWLAQQYWNQLSSFYYNLIGGNLEGILGDIQGITGALGIPDPFAIRTSGAWDEKIPGTMSTAQAKANTTDRAIADGIASTILGKSGQTVIREQQQQIASHVEQSASKAQQSAVIAQSTQSRNVTQDILKDAAIQQALMAQQQTDLVQVNQQMSGQLTGLQLQGAAHNLMLSDISGTLDQQELQRQQAQQANNLSEAQTMAQVFIPGLNDLKIRATLNTRQTTHY